MSQENEIYRYCREHIPMFSLKEQIAWGVMDESRCDLRTASNLYEEMESCIEDWADENETSAEDIDVEEVFFSGPGEE